MSVNLGKLVGRKINKIYFNEDYLKFETDDGNLVFTTDGDCCSQSVFYDFYGVKKLLNNGKVVSVKEIELLPSDIKKVKTSYGEEQQDKKSYQESISVYGFEIVTIDPKTNLEVTSVFSFRNYSNGYYGGSLEDDTDKEVSPEIFNDVTETQNIKD